MILLVASPKQVIKVQLVKVIYLKKNIEYKKLFCIMVQKALRRALSLI